MQNIGYIKIHRKIRDNPIFWKPNYLAVFMYIILDVEFEACKKPLRGDLIDLKAGEGLFFQKEIADKMGISLGTVSNIIKKLNSENIIEIKTTQKYSIIGLVNWDSYQSQIENTSENELKTEGKRTENELKHLKNTKKTKEYKRNNTEDFTEKNYSKLESKIISTPEGTARHDFYSFLLEINDRIEEELDIEKIDNKIKEFVLKLGEQRAVLELESFIEHHRNEKTIFKSTIGRLNTWLANKIK